MPGVWEPTRGTIPCARLAPRSSERQSPPTVMTTSASLFPARRATRSITAVAAGLPHPYGDRRRLFKRSGQHTHHKRRRGSTLPFQEGRGDTSATRAHSRADQRQLPRVSLNTLETRGGHLYKHKFDGSQTEWGGLSVARPIRSHQSVRLDPAHPNKYKFAWSASADQVKHRKVSGIKSEKKHPVELLNLDSTADDGPPHQLIVSSTALSNTSSKLLLHPSKLARTLRALSAQSSQLMVGLPSWEVTT
ncbi:unnamed protein product [Zymoseptoria tritici ST99CH_1E4]|uniref:Uncharacterized protein n=1 Tax=Zymoseptoria tritici ST99CH_1E4 TaxID=1276532 RepID=A0A2H1GQ40_ZYMTR|nr:unnamed protein product [Zymoseptoria tritici ST99CH_1E4]